MSAGVTVSAAFDAGAIEAGEIGEAPNGVTLVRLSIPADRTTDASCDFRQWFHFRVQGVRGRALEIEIGNAGRCTYPEGWRDYRACASYDHVNWFRVPTSFDGTRLTIRHHSERDGLWFAYFEPYSWERHLALIGRVGASPLARIERLGASVQGRDLDLVTLGEAGPGKANIWVIARQHPGETMAEWFVEGLLERMLDAADPLARTLVQRAVLYIVPNMNPDGSVLGNLRANAAGANLNREWLSPSRERSPEVFFVRERMHVTGVDAFLDVHGDEGLPYVFVAGSEMLPGFTPAQLETQRAFCEQFMRASPDFQTERGYGSGKYQADALKLASKYVGHTFGCLSLTLEMPFKDNANLPDAQVGWNGARSARLGAAVLAPLLASLKR